MDIYEQIFKEINDLDVVKRIISDKDFDPNKAVSPTGFQTPLIHYALNYPNALSILLKSGKMDIELLHQDLTPLEKITLTSSSVISNENKLKSFKLLVDFGGKITSYVIIYLIRHSDSIELIELALSYNPDLESIKDKVIGAINYDMRQLGDEHDSFFNMIMNKALGLKTRER